MASSVSSAARTTPRPALFTQSQRFRTVSLRGVVERKRLCQQDAVTLPFQLRRTLDCLRRSALTAARTVIWSGSTFSLSLNLSARESNK